MGDNRAKKLIEEKKLYETIRLVIPGTRSIFQCLLKKWGHMSKYVILLPQTTYDSRVRFRSSCGKFSGRYYQLNFFMEQLMSGLNEVIDT